MSDKRCDGCKHWVEPGKRTDFRSPVSADHASYGTEEYKQARRAQERADMLLGQCKGVPFFPTVSELPNPHAAVIDGSEYYAELFTAADFYCALFAGISEVG